MSIIYRSQFIDHISRKPLSPDNIFQHFSLCKSAGYPSTQKPQSLLSLIDQDDVKSVMIEQKASKKPLSGWRGGLSINIIITLVIMLMNVSFLIWACKKYGTSGGVGVLYHGECSHASRLTTIAHTVINILSTLLLGASNYAMQVVGSPTRTEVDRAHKLGKWLDVGCQSYRTCYLHLLF